MGTSVSIPENKDQEMAVIDNDAIEAALDRCRDEGWDHYKHKEDGYQTIGTVKTGNACRAGIAMLADEAKGEVGKNTDKWLFVEPCRPHNGEDGGGTSCPMKGQAAVIDTKFDPSQFADLRPPSYHR